MPAVLESSVSELRRTICDEHHLVARLLPSKHDVHPKLSKLRHAAQASNEELLTIVVDACAALNDVGQEAAFEAAARPLSGERDSWQSCVAEKRTASGEPVGDETLNSTTLIPLLRRATRLAGIDPELGERLLESVGILTAILAGYGEHTYRIDLGGMRTSLVLRHVGCFPPVARLGIGALVAEWAGTYVAHRTVLELCCGTGGVGLACAALGAREVWCTDLDEDALAMAERNSTANGATAVRVARLDVRDEAGVGLPETCRFGLVVAAIVGDGFDDTSAAAALKAAARYIDASDPLARVLFCFGQASRPGDAQRGAESFEGAVRLGENVLDSGLLLLASERVPADECSDEMFVLLLGRSDQDEVAAAAPAAGAIAAAPAAAIAAAPAATPTPSTGAPESELLRVLHEIDAAASADWVRSASRSLVHNGACVLRRLSPIPTDVVERCRCDARPRLDRLLGLAAEANANEPGGAVRFQELYSRAPWEHRFDVTVSHVHAGSTTTAGAPSIASAPWQELLNAIDPIVRPVLAASGLFGDGDQSDDEIVVDHVGYVLSMPGAPGQMWHPDCVDRVGLVNVFVPLVPLSEANGPTALALGSHRPPRPSCPRVVRPLLNVGEVLLFDWRTWHRGCANSSPADRPVAYVTYVPCGVEGASYKRGLRALERSSG